MAGAACEGQHGRMATLQRPRAGRVIAGVCAAIAARFGWSTTLVRVIFIASLLLPGPQILLYVLLWVFIPSEK
jgi:phage shock protein PspC (stress-responsive transcriptional regulator)